MLGTVIVETRRAGHKVSLDGRLLKVSVAAEVVDLFVREKIVRTDHVPLPDEKWAPAYDLQPTGQLRVCIEASWLSPRTLWDESAGKPPSQMVPKVLNGLSRAAAAIHTERLAQEHREAEYRERRMLEQELQARRAVELQHAEHLLSLVERWDRSRQIRAFLTAVRESRHEHAPPPGWGRSLEEWLSWGERYADQLDPLVPSAEAD
jgi:hypothetical protein